MIYTAIAVVGLLGAVLIGSTSPHAHRQWLAASVALAAVAAQFALLMWA